MQAPFRWMIKIRWSFRSHIDSDKPRLLLKTPTYSFLHLRSSPIQSASGGEKKDAHVSKKDKAIKEGSYLSPGYQRPEAASASVPTHSLSIHPKYLEQQSSSVANIQV